MGLIVGLSPLPPPGTGFLSQHCRTPGWEPQACPSAARGPGSARPLPDPSGLRPQPSGHCSWCAETARRRSGWARAALEPTMGVDGSPARTQWSAPGTCPRRGHQSGEPLSDAAVLETPPGPWPAASSFLPLHESAYLSPRPGTCGSCHVRSSGSLCSEKKSFQGFKLEKTPKRKHLHFPFSGQPRKWWPACSPPAQEVLLGVGGGAWASQAHSCKGSRALPASSLPQASWWLQGPPVLPSKGSFLCSFPFL